VWGSGGTGIGVVGSGGTGVAGTSNNVAGYGVSGNNSSSGAGMYGVSDGGGIGVWGSGGTGVQGNSTSASGYGMYGVNTSTSNLAVAVYGDAANGIGLLGASASANGVAGVLNNTAGGKILSGQNNGTEKFSVDSNGDVVTAGAVLTTIPNSSNGNGTCYYCLAKIDPTNGFATVTGTGDSTGILGVVVAGPGKIGSAQIAVAGQALCWFDGATTAGDYVRASPSTAGYCTDVGASYPTSGQVLGRVLQTKGSSGACYVYLFGAEQRANAATVTNGAYINSANTFTAAQTITASGTTLSAGGGTTGVQANGSSTGVSGTGSTGVFGTGTSASGYGVYGVNSTGTAIYGAGLTGLFGTGSSTGVAGYGPTGVSGNSTSSTGYGVYGSNSAPSGTGVYGTASSTSGQNYGVYGMSSSASGYGVHGVNSGGTAIYGTGVTGVYGSSSVSSGNGVYGTSSGSGGSGVYGSTSGFVGNGVMGSGNSSNGTGVYGTGFYGVYGTGTGIGVYGVASGSGPGIPTAVKAYGICTGCRAGDFAGDVVIAGTLNANVKNFRIDHPLDPANKYLYHSSVESSEMIDIYTGNVTLDTNGEAWVKLPDWFEALNRDFRYQLTPIGRPGPGTLLYIAEEISGNQFKIAGGSPALKISWQVTAIRQDAYAKAHPTQVEVEKQGEERGKYIHPELFGQPETMGVDYKHRPPAAGGLQGGQDSKQH
jgi:hypothetical protein